jgi:hypothetical protein
MHFYLHLLRLLYRDNDDDLFQSPTCFKRLMLSTVAPSGSRCYINIAYKRHVMISSPSLRQQSITIINMLIRELINTLRGHTIP